MSTHRIRRLVLPALAAALLASAAGPGSARAYNYPVKPFDREHPVRGGFGDPRTIFSGPPTAATVAHAGGKFAFHEGVDIAAPNGTAVYPVASGTVVEVKHGEDWWIGVSSGQGSGFDYWHVTPSVHVGQRVVAYRTVLGHVRRPASHVHLTQWIDGRPVNPLAPGRLEPYHDATRPTVRAISFRVPGTTEPILPSFVRGSVDLAAEAFDVPSLEVPGAWRGLPTAPALLSWRIQGWTGKAVVPEHVAVDFRVTVPADSAFWTTYARGTYQNMCVFGPHYSFVQPGSYVFRLGRTLDTRSLADGVYDVVVTASDIAGNTSSLTQRFTVHNRAGWIGS